MTEPLEQLRITTVHLHNSVVARLSLHSLLCVYQQNLFSQKNTSGLASKAIADRNKMLWVNHTKRQPSEWHLHQGRMQHHCFWT